MNRKLLLSGAVALLTGSALLLLESPLQGFARTAETPRVIVLGFDGVDSELAARWMESGDLPNLKKLAESGSFRPLTTANPAQSPVSWAVMETGSNPGKTNLGDFVRRVFIGDNPMPNLAGIKDLAEPVSASELGDHVQLTGMDRFLVPLGVERNAYIALALLFGGLLLVLSLTFRRVLRMPVWLSLLVGVLLSGGAAYGGHVYLNDLPSKYPFAESEMQGKRFWNVLGDAGKTFAGLQVPAAYPCETHPNARLLAGLFTPDIGGSIGSWYIYTNDEWAMNDESTGSGGTVFKLYEEPDGSYKSFLRGPTDFIAQFGYEDRERALAEQLEAEGLSDEKRKSLKQQQSKLKSDKRSWSSYDKKKKADFLIRPDYDARTAVLTIDGQQQEVREGDYSEWFKVSFALSRAFPFDAVARIYLEECFIDENGEKRLRMFVPPLSISPENPPPHMPISAPPDYASELAAAIGLYDTVGWACYTNALKDSETSEEAFLKGLEHVMDWRTRLFMHELGKDDWDVLFHMEGATDRAAHMLYEFLDPEHPHHDDKDRDGNLMREKEVSAYGRSFKLKDAIRETYKEMDRIVGDTLAKIDSGALGSDVRLMIISDHGFEPYRYGVDLNVWLNRMGYLARSGEGDKIGAEGGLKNGETGEMFRYVDWSRTKAYSMGLGKIYINLAGREPKGIVKPEEYDALKKEIIERLEAFVDPIDGHGKRRVVLRAYDAFEVYDGPEENITDFGDIILGFNSGYRVAGTCTMGGFGGDVYDTFGIGVNDDPWSGDHCGVELSLVEGIFYSNFKVKEGFQPDLLNIAPTVLDMLGVDIPEEWDGVPMPRN